MRSRVTYRLGGTPRPTNTIYTIYTLYTAKTTLPLQHRSAAGRTVLRLLREAGHQSKGTLRALPIRNNHQPLGIRAK